MNKKTSPLLLGGMLVIAIAISVLILNKKPETPQNAVTAIAATAEQHDVANPVAVEVSGQKKTAALSSADETFQRFDEWLHAGSEPQDSDSLAEAIVELAKVRHKHMSDLIKKDPQAALRKAVSLQEYASLPTEVARWVERPFSSQANLMILPNEPGPFGKIPANFGKPSVSLVLRDGGNKSYTLYRYGNRANVLSKDGIAIQGIILDDVAAIEDTALAVVADKDREFVQKKFPAMGTVTEDFYTGESIQDEPVIALAGGRIFHFASEANVEKLNTKLARLEAKIGPKTGSQVLFQTLPSLPSDQLNSAIAIQQTTLSNRLDALLVAASNWTETPKKVFFIRVDFSDKPGAAITKDALKTALNSPVSNLIQSMSQGKTSINAEVSDQVVRMPSASTVYAPGNGSHNSGQLYSDAITAFDALNTGVNLDDYHIVGLHFGSIGMPYAGLASVGGSRHWLHNTSSTYVIAHEFGHNYGLQHANFWETNNNSVIGAGANEEYGDKYDIMGASFDIRGHFHQQARAKLNWLEAEDWTAVTESGQHRVYRFDDNNASGNRALKISRGRDGDYWVGFRQLFTDNKWLQNGIYLIWQRPGTTTGWLVDTTPGSFADNDDDKNDAGVVLGRTYSDTDANIHITPLAKGGSAPNEWIDVQVNLGDFAGNSAPSVSISGDTSADARSAITFSANASDPDGDTLAYAWDFGDGVIHASTASIDHTWATGGTYTVKVTVSDMKGGTDTAQTTVTVSDPLDTWNSRSSGSSQDLMDIATDGNKVVAVADGGEILTSSDAATWSKQDLGGNIKLYGVDFANGLWVAVGMDYRFSAPAGWIGVIYTSTDATTWTSRYTASSTDSKVNNLVYGNGAWVAVANNGGILRSTDGTTWTSQTSGITHHIEEVAFGNNVFVATGGRNGQNNVVLTSPDGVTWTDRSSGAGTSQAMWYINYLDDRFIGDGFYTGLRYSTDNGVSFQRSNLATSYAFPAIVYGSGVYFGGGINRSGGADQNAISVDGVTWNVSAATDQPNRNAAVFFNNTFITVGDDGSIQQSAILPVGVADTTPDAFSFTDQTDVARSTQITSNAVTVSGINSAAAISVTDGEYSIDGGAYTNSNGTVTNGQTVTVRHTSSSNYSTQIDTTLTIGGVSDTFSSTTQAEPADTTPNPFSFTAKTGVARNTTQVSNTITVSGINASTLISVTGGEYSINGGAYTSSAGTVTNGQTVTVRHTSSSNYSTQVNTILTIGGISDTFSSTTEAVPVDTTPNQFTFTDQIDVAISTQITSVAVTVSGINSAAPVSVRGGEYRINTGSFTSTTGTVNDGDTVQVRHTSSSSFGAETATILTIGDISDIFSSTTLSEDTTPDQFAFTDQTDVAISTQITSAAITVNGINSAAPISVSGGEYNINGGGFTGIAGTVGNGDRVQVRHTSSGSFNTVMDTTLTIGGISDTFSSTTLAADTTPNQFNLTDQTGVELSTQITSAAVTVSGINSAAPISVSGGEYNINGGSFTNVAGTVDDGDRVQVRHMSSASFGTETATTLNIGGVSDTFSSTTLGEDTTPEQFTFTDQTDVATSTQATSNTVTVSGINSAAPISVSGGEYNTNGGGFTSTAGTVDNGDTVQVRHTSSGSFNTVTDTTLTIGGVSDTFSSTTLGEDTTPEQFTFTDQTDVAISTQATSNAVTVSGINSTAPITVVNGQYNINGGGFTNAAGTVDDGDRVQVRHMSSASFGTETATTLNIGGVSDTFSSTTLGEDTTPEQFNFTDQTGVELSTQITSVTVTVSGINSAAPISVSGGEYNTNGGGFTSTAGTVDNGDTVQVRHMSSASFGTETATTLAIGGVSDTFSSTTLAADTTPNQFTFTGQTGVELSTQITSAAVTVSGINSASPVSVAGGEYNINGGSFTNAAGTVDDGDRVQVRHTSSGSFNTVMDTTLTIGGISDTFSSTTLAADTTPNQFNLTDQTGVELSTQITSAAVTASGINSAAPISVSGGEYNINGGSFTNAAGTVDDGDRVQVRHMSSASFGTETATTLNIGGVSDTFSSTTLGEDTTPEQFSFTDQTGVELSTQITSAAITVSGINSAAPISVSSGQYNINGGGFTNVAGTVDDGDRVQVRHMSSVSFGTETATTLAIGGVTDIFSSTTLGEDTTPDQFAFTDQTGVELSAQITSAAVTVSGINSAAPISVSSGQYNINGGGFTSAAGTVNNGDTVQVRHTSSASYDTKVDSILTIDGISATFGSITKLKTIDSPVFILKGTTWKYLDDGSDQGTAWRSDTFNDSHWRSGTAQLGYGDGDETTEVSYGADSNAKHITTYFRYRFNLPDASEYQRLQLDLLRDDGVVVYLNETEILRDNMPTGEITYQTLASDTITGSDENAFTQHELSSASLVSGINTLAVEVHQRRADSTDISLDLALTGIKIDTTPDTFNFTPKTAVSRNTEQVSNITTVSGINSAAPISVSGGEYNINGGSFTNAAGTVDNGDRVQVRHLSSASFGTETVTMLTIGGVSGTFSSTTLAADTTPDVFSFTDQTGVGLGTQVTSNTVTVSSINSAVPISVSGGEYNINGGSFTNAAGTVDNGDRVQVRHTSSGSFNTVMDTTLTIGGISDTFSTTTLDADTTPEQFSFTPKTSVELSTQITSTAITVSGINSAADISASGGQYNINGGDFTSAAGTVNDGDIVQVRHTSSSSFETVTSTTLTIGGVSGAFNSTTKAESDGDVTPPVVTAPANLTKVSKGYKTRLAIADLKQQGSATDETDGTLDIVLDSVNGEAPVYRVGKTVILLRPGRHILTWSATDNAGNKGKADQQVDVLPQASFQVNQSASEGQTVSVEAILNGDAPTYPVSIPFTISGSADTQDYQLDPDAQAIIITQPTGGARPSGKIDVTLLDDGVGENNERIFFDMGELQNAVQGRKTRHRITILAQDIPPRARLRVTQNGIKGNKVYQNDGTVLVTANAKDPNGDSLTYQWFSQSLADSNQDGDPATFEIDPLLHATGRHTLSLHVSDGTHTIEKRKRIRIKSGGAITFGDNTDTDGDGIPDKDEPGDENGNGIPDYLEDAGMDTCQLLVGQDTPMETDPGLSFETGDAAQGQDNNTGNLSEEQLKNYMESENGNYQADSNHTPTLILDYKIHGLEEVGSTVSIVVSLAEALPANATIRKYTAGNGWQGFTVDANNRLETAISADGNCPTDGSITYQTGVQTGATCLRLTIQDGGPNDADGLANGTIEDPLAVATEDSQTSDGGNSASSGGGGSMSPYLLLVLLAGMLFIQLFKDKTRRLS